MTKMSVFDYQQTELDVGLTLWSEPIFSFIQDGAAVAGSIYRLNFQNYQHIGQWFAIGPVPMITIFTTYK